MVLLPVIIYCMKKEKIKMTIRIVIYIVIAMVVMLIILYRIRWNSRVISPPVCETCTIINKK